MASPYPLVIWSVLFSQGQPANSDRHGNVHLRSKRTSILDPCCRNIFVIHDLGMRVRNYREEIIEVIGH